MSCWFKAEYYLGFPIHGSKFSQPFFYRLKAFLGIAKLKRPLTQLTSSRVYCTGVMGLTSDITSDDQHILCNEGYLVILGELTMCFKFSPCMSF